MAKKKPTACAVIADALREQGHDLSEDEVERIYHEQMRLRESNPLIRAMQDWLRDEIKSKMKRPN